MIEEQPRALARRQRLAVNGDLVGGADIERRRRDGGAIDGDTSGRDPGFRLAAGAQTGARHHLGDAFARLKIALALAGHGPSRR